MDRIVDIATDGLHLSAHLGFLIVARDREEQGRVALDDVPALIVHAHAVTWSTNLVVALAERGALVVLCGSNHAPVALMTPIALPWRTIWSNPSVRWLTRWFGE